MYTDNFKPSQITVIEKTLQEKALGLRQESKRILKELRDIEDAIEKFQNMSGTASGTIIERAVDETLAAIIHAHKSLSGSWNKPKDIRVRYKFETNKEITKYTLRKYHNDNLDLIFEKRGDGRTAEYRLVKKPQTELSMNNE